MPRPLMKPWLVKLRLTDDEHAACVALAAGQPVAPAIVAAALRPPMTVPALLDALDAAVGRLVSVRDPMAREALTAAAALRRALR